MSCVAGPASLLPAESHGQIQSGDCEVETIATPMSPVGSSPVFSTSPQSISSQATNFTPPESPLLQPKKTVQSRNLVLLETKSRDNAQEALPEPTLLETHFEKLELVSEGCWSKVYHAWATTGLRRRYLDTANYTLPHAVCVKQPSSRLAKKILNHEARILTYLSRHVSMKNFVVEFYGLHSDSCAVTMSFVSMSLEDFSFKNEAMKLSSNHNIAVATFSGIAHGLVEGLDFLHSCGVIHADIKPANILVATRPKPRSNRQVEHLEYIPLYCDFSAAFVPSLEAGPPDSAQTWEYMSPEMLSIDAVPSFATDVFALALTLIAGLTGTSPYSVPGMPAIVRRTLARDGNPAAALQTYHAEAYARLISTGFDHFLEETMCKDPRERITAADWRSRALNFPLPRLEANGIVQKTS